MAHPYLVVVDAEYQSEWYLTPLSFPTHLEALRHAAGIANSWRGRLNTPTISIKGPERNDTFSAGFLHSIGTAYSWFED